jgi:carboxyl-terminal processing protease
MLARRKSLSFTLSIVLSIAGLIVFTAATRGADPPLVQGAAAQAAVWANIVSDITDTVLEHHIDPPVRQQMILDFFRKLYSNEAKKPDDLAARVSSVTNREQVVALFKEFWPASGVKPGSDEMLMTALVSSVPGGAELVTAKDRKVNEQIQGNRYVGIHIAIGVDDVTKRPKIVEMIKGGPADRAGMKANDVIERIDDVDTSGQSLRESIDRLRGDEGTSVAVTVRQPGDKAARTYRVVRGTMPQATISGVTTPGTEPGFYRVDGQRPIGYVRISSLSGSTAHELRKLSVQLESDGLRALVLDLRGLSGDSVHDAVKVADALLEGGKIGRVKTARGERVYESDADAIFRGWPMVVLVDQNTTGTGAWLAAALQDHRRPLVGSRDRSPRALLTMRNPMLAKPAAVERATVPIGDGSWSITLVTGRLERGDGRPLGDSSSLVSNVIFREPPPAAQPPIDSENDKPILKPDHLVGAEPRTTEVAKARANARPPAETAPSVNLFSDDVLYKAVQLLRESLKKT